MPNPTTFLCGTPNVLFDPSVSVDLGIGGAPAPFDEANLVDPDIHTRARTTKLFPRYTEIYIDLGAGFANLPVRTLAVINGNWSPTATYAVLGSGTPILGSTRIVPNDVFIDNGFGLLSDVTEGQLLAPDGNEIDLEFDGTAEFGFPTLPGPPVGEGREDHCCFWVLARMDAPSPTAKLILQLRDNTGLKKEVTYRPGLAHGSFLLPFDMTGIDQGSIQLWVRNSSPGGSHLFIEAVDLHWEPTPPAPSHFGSWSSMSSVTSGPGGIGLEHLPPGLNRSFAVDLGATSTDKRYWKIAIRDAANPDGYVSAGLCWLSPALEGVRLIDDNSIRARAVGQELLETELGGLVNVPPTVIRREMDLTLHGDEDSGLRKLAGSLLLSGALHRPFLVMVNPEALPDDQSIVGFLGVVDSGGAARIELKASTRGSPVVNAFAVVEIT